MRTEHSKKENPKTKLSVSLQDENNSKESHLIEDNKVVELGGDASTLTNEEDEYYEAENNEYPCFPIKNQEIIED